MPDLKTDICRPPRVLRIPETGTERIPPGQLPADKRFNPLVMNPYMLYKALPQVRRYRSAELVRAMEILLQCNQRLIFSGLDDKLVLQQSLVDIVRGEGTSGAPALLDSKR